MEVINIASMLTIITVGAGVHFIASRRARHAGASAGSDITLAPFRKLALARICRANGLIVLLGASTGAGRRGARHSARVPTAQCAAVSRRCGAVICSRQRRRWRHGYRHPGPPDAAVGLLFVLSIIPLQLLSGGVTLRVKPCRCWCRDIMLGAPTTYILLRLAQGHSVSRHRAGPGHGPATATGFHLALLRFRRR